MFLAPGFLFWWPVFSLGQAPHWAAMVAALYLFLATLPCDILSGFLVSLTVSHTRCIFSTPRLFGFFRS